VNVPAVRENTAALQPGQGKTWRRLVGCHFQTYPYARISRVVCGEHGVRLSDIEYFEMAIKSTAKGSISTHARSKCYCSVAAAEMQEIIKIIKECDLR
jgi:hypothetical protein